RRRERFADRQRDGLVAFYFLRQPCDVPAQLRAQRRKLGAGVSRQPAGGDGQDFQCAARVARDRLDRLLGEEGLSHGPLAFRDLFARLGDQRFVDDPQQFVVLPEAERERDGDDACADEQAHAQLIEVVNEAQPILVADRTERPGHGGSEPTTAPPVERRLKAAASGVDGDRETLWTPRKNPRSRSARRSRPPTRSRLSPASRAPLRSRPAPPDSCTSASTAPASWSTRSTGPRKARGTGGSCCAAPSASRAARACSTRQPWKSSTTSWTADRARCSATCAG